MSGRKRNRTTELLMLLTVFVIQPLCESSVLNYIIALWVKQWKAVYVNGLCVEVLRLFKV